MIYCSILNYQHSTPSLLILLAPSVLGEKVGDERRIPETLLDHLLLQEVGLEGDIVTRHPHLKLQIEGMEVRSCLVFGNHTP